MSQRAVVVTGATGGLGTALVRELVTAGQAVVAVGRGLTQTDMDAIHGAGRVLAASFDVTARTAWEPCLAAAERDGFIVAGAVLAAGGWAGGERLHEAKDDSTWNAMLGANLETARVSLAALLPGMVARQRGSVVVIGSMASVRPWESARAAAYAAAKAAVVGLAQATAAEVLRDGVRVNVVLPSTIDTPKNRASMPNADFSRWVTPASLGAVIAFLLSDASRDVSGAALPVYGGVTV